MKGENNRREKKRAPQSRGERPRTYLSGEWIRAGTCRDVFHRGLVGLKNSPLEEKRVQGAFIHLLFNWGNPSTNSPEGQTSRLVGNGNRSKNKTLFKS